MGGGRTIGIQKAIIPFNCDINDQIEPNSVCTVKLIYFIFSRKITSLLFIEPHTVPETDDVQILVLLHCKGWRIESSPWGTTKVIHYGHKMRVSAAMPPKAPYTPIQGTEQEAHTALSHIPACWRSSGSLPLQKWNKSLFSDTAMPHGREMYISAFPDPVQLCLSCYFLHRMMMWFYLDRRLCGTETSDPTTPVSLITMHKR